jgi:hypothetical protein
MGILRRGIGLSNGFQIIILSVAIFAMWTMVSAALGLIVGPLIRGSRSATKTSAHANPHKLRNRRGEPAVLSPSAVSVLSQPRGTGKRRNQPSSEGVLRAYRRL